MRILAVVSVSLVLAGCRQSVPAAPDAQAAEAIRNLADPERIHALNTAASRRGESASLVALAQDPDVRVRFGAAYVAALWADDARDAEALVPLLSDADEATRAVVAGSLAGLGHAGARSTLQALSGSATPMPFSDPPITVGRFATESLVAIEAAGARQ